VPQTNKKIADLIKKAAGSDTAIPNQALTIFSMLLPRVGSPASSYDRPAAVKHSGCQLLPFGASFHIAEAAFNSREVAMPVVHIYMYAGRTKEQKNEMVKRISKDFQEVMNVKPESLNVLFHDMEKSDWGINGALASEAPPK
jgi:4-oxalocrotonate tautomerase